LETEKDSSSPLQKLSLLRGLLGTLVVVFAFVVSFWSKFRAPQENSGAPQHPQDTTTNERQRSQPIVPTRVFLERIPPPTPSQEAREDRKEGRERKNLWIQGAIAFFACAYAALAFCQWRAQANALKVDQRAWVGLDKPMIAEKINFPGPRFTWSGTDGVIHQPDTPNPLIHTGVSLNNFGKTPAFDVIVSVFSSGEEMLENISNAQCESAEKASRGEGPHNYKWPTAGKTIFPGQPTFEPKDVPGGDIPKLFIVGCIAYRDAFNERHRTRFCYRTPQIVITDPVMKDGDAFRQCNIYNDAN